MNLESDIRLEILLVSLSLDNYEDYLNELVTSGHLRGMELKILDKYKFLVTSIKNIPSRELLIKEFPELSFTGVEPISKEELSDFVQLFLTKRINDENSYKIIKLSEKVKNEGLTQDVIEEINSISKSDNIKSEFEDITKTITEKYKDKDLALGFQTGVTEIDKRTGGLHLGSVNTIMGYAGSGKTTWGVNIAYNSLQEGYNVLYLSLEVSKEHILYDLLSRHSNESQFKGKIIKHRNIKQRNLKKDEEEFLWNTIYPDFLKTKGKIYIVDETDLDNYSAYTLENKFREIDKLAQEETGKGISLVFVDHAQLLKFEKSIQSRDEFSTINYYVSFFRQQAVNFIKEKRPACFVVLSQTNRDGWKYAARHEGNYQLNALAEANELERASSIVLSIFTDEVMMNSNQALVKVCKSRDTGAMEEAVSTDIFPESYLLGDYSTGVPQDMANISMDDLFQPTFDNPVLDSMANGSNSNNPFGDMSELDALIGGE